METHTQMDELNDTIANLKNKLEQDYQALPQIIQQDDAIKQKMKLLDTK